MLFDMNKQYITSTKNTVSLFTNIPEIKARCGILFAILTHFKIQYIRNRYLQIIQLKLDFLIIKPRVLSF